MNGLAVLNFEFSREYLRAALMVSLLSVWLLVGLFYYLNRYTRREYFTIWTAAWLFYALWLTLSLQLGDEVRPREVRAGDFLFFLQQACVAISAVFLLWGSLRFLGLPVRQALFGLFMAFVLVWTWVSPYVLENPLEVQVPVFILLGLGSVFAGACFFRLRRKMPYVGAGMLSLGFLLWGFYLASYPFARESRDPDLNLYGAGFMVAAVLQLFIAVSMIVLVLEEVRYKTEQVLEEIATVRTEKEMLESKVITTEEQCRRLYDKVRLTEGAQRAYEQLRQTQEVVVQQERLRALGQMASGIAHDINNSLSPIVAYSELVQLSVPNLPDTARSHIRNIQKSAQDIAHIVKRMREFYRQRSGDEPLQEVSVNAIVEEVIALTRPRWHDDALRQGISISVESELDPATPVVLPANPSELREALTNLIFNAVDAMPQGGRIRLNAFTRQPSAGQATESAGKQVVIEVQDGGLGMTEEVRQRCLEPFFSTKFQRGGTGLGLAMVFGMVQRHNGQMEIDSTPGQGTCIRLIFPLRASSPSTKEEATEATRPARNLKILCIDDEEKIRRMLEDCLQGCGHQITVAENGRQGLDLFVEHLNAREPFDVVVTDLGMPELDGRQVARLVKEKSPSTPVILLTGWATQIKEDGEVTKGMDAIIGKPPSIIELNATLQRLTAEQTRADTATSAPT